MPLYFAYGSNMDVEAMTRRCPRAKPIGVARLARHQLAVMREGWLTAVRNPPGDVHGVLWEVAFADMRALDQYEQLASGLYTKAQQPVIGERGAKRWSISAPIPGPASPRPTTSPAGWRRRGIGSCRRRRSPGLKPSPPRPESPGPRRPRAPSLRPARACVRASRRHSTGIDWVVGDRVYGRAAPPEKVMPARPRI
jgi:hypothetical protein